MNLGEFELEKPVSLEGFLFFFPFQSVEDFVLNSPGVKSFHSAKTDRPRMVLPAWAENHGFARG
jgi:hypothetical protein